MGPATSLAGSGRTQHLHELVHIEYMYILFHENDYSLIY